MNFLIAILFFGSLNIGVTTARSLLSTTSRSFNTSSHAKRDDPNGHNKDDFGKSVAIQSGVAIVGSPEDDDNAVAFDSGRVFVYIENYNRWELIREIEDGEPGDYFGWSLALHTDLFAVVGACRDNLFGQFSGGAYYMFIETNPYAEQDEPVRVIQTERHGGAFFGYSVAITESLSGEVTVAIGAYGHRGKGAVFIYTRQVDGSLGGEHILYGSDSEHNDKFGWSVSLLGDIVAAGAPLDDEQGSAYVFVKIEDQWTQKSKLMQSYGDDDEDNPLIGDFFGVSVAVCDGYVVVAAPHNDVRGTDAGAVFVYQEVAPASSIITRKRRQLTEKLNDYVSLSTIDSVLDKVYGSDSSTSRSLEDIGSYSFVQTIFALHYQAKSRFGWQLSYDPVYGRLAVGTDSSQIQESGSVFIYDQSEDEFFTIHAAKKPEFNEDDDYGEESDSNFGASVSIHGDYLAVGANRGYGEVKHSGDVYFFRALTAKEYAGHLDSTGAIITENEAAGIGVFGILMICVLLSLSIAFCRYKSKGDSEGFGTYISDSASDMWSSMTSFKRTSDGHAHTSLQFLEDEDSAHSSHPMMDDVKLKSTSNDRAAAASPSGDSTTPAAEKKISKVSTAAQKSPGSYPAKASKSRVQLAGMTTAKRQGYATPSLNDL